MGRLLGVDGIGIAMRTRWSTLIYQDQVKRLTNVRNSITDQCTLGVAETARFCESTMLMSAVINTTGFALTPTQQDPMEHDLRSAAEHLQRTASLGHTPKLPLPCDTNESPGGKLDVAVVRLICVSCFINRDDQS